MLGSSIIASEVTYLKYLFTEEVAPLGVLHVELVLSLTLSVVVEPDDVGVSHPRVDRALSAGKLMR